MEIGSRLNLVVPYEQNGITRYVHAMPITRATFDRHYMVLAKTFATIYGEGLGYLAGPRVAALILRDVARGLGTLDEVENGLLQEIKRMCNVVDGAGVVTPLADAIRDKMISEDDMSVIENALAFFTVASAMHRKEELAVILKGAATYWGAQVSSLNPTEFVASSKTSTEAVSSGATLKEEGKLSSLPS